MNNRELRVQDLISGFRRDWKLFLVIVAWFLLLGLAAGFFFSGRASAEGSGSAQASVSYTHLTLPTIDDV